MKTVISVSVSRNSRDEVCLRIEDEHSGDKILVVTFTLEDYALLLTGLSGIKAQAEYNENANIAKRRVVRTVSCEKYTGKQQQKEIVLEDFKQYKSDGWELHSDGTSSQQRGGQHNYVIKKYEPVDNPEIVEDKW